MSAKIPYSVSRTQRVAALSLALLITACDTHKSPTAPANNPSDVLVGRCNSTTGEQRWVVFDAPPSGRANQGVISDGEFVGTDEIHFARGANVDNTYHEQYWAPGGVPPEPAPFPQDADDVYRHSTWGAFGTDRAPHNGDYLLPQDTTNWPDFTADIAFVRMEANSTDLYVHMRFVSFPNATAQIGTITFKTTGNAPALQAWPQNAGVSSTYSHAITLHGTGAFISHNGNHTDLATLGGAVCVTDHAFEARIPLTSLPAGPWQIGAGSGLADPNDTTQYWTVPGAAATASTPGTDTGPSDGAPLGANVWDLAFTPHDPRWHDDHIQGDLLLSQDVSTAIVEVDLAALQARSTTIAPPITGRIAHTYQSAFDFGDGITRSTPSFSAPATGPTVPNTSSPPVPRDPGVNYEYTGAMQPYFAFIPPDYATTTNEWPLVLYLHGLNNYIWEPFGLTLGLEDELTERGYLFASTLGRGDISYTDRGELDPLEVIEHMAARYRIDRQRIYIVGHSHGGGGVMNISRRNPDKFAAVVSAQINTQSAQPENYLYVPTLHIAGAGDPIDNGPGALSRYNALRDLGYDSQAIIYTLKTHENASIYDAIEQIFDIYDRSMQPVNPAKVVFTRAGGDFNTELGLLHNSAYWVSAMVAGDDSVDMHITAESFAIAHAPLDPANATITTNNAYDSMGASGRSNGTHYQTVPAYGPAAPIEERLTIETRNVTEVTLDIQRTSLQLNANGARLDTTLSDDLQLTLSNSGLNTLNWQALDGGDNVIASGIATATAAGLVLPLPNVTARVVFPQN